MPIARRHLLSLAVAAPVAAQAQGTTDPRIWPPRERFALWPGLPPGAPPALPRPTAELIGEPGGYRDYWARGTLHPEVGVYRPARADGRAMLVIPGGGYGFVSLRNEGGDVAGVLNAHGITAFVLSYRLPGDGWADRADVPLADAQRAMRLIRSDAARFGIDAGRLGAIGFSAGGHLAGSLATLGDLPVYRAIDAADRVSARPAVAALLYAVASMDPGRSNGGSRANLLGPHPSAAMVSRYAVDRRIGRRTPPLFVAHAADDSTVPIVNAHELIAAAQAASVPVESHIFARGGHGFGTRLPRSMPGSLWPDLFVRWYAEALEMRR